MFCCEINEVSSSQRIEYQPTPLKLKIIQKLGLSNFVIDKLVFVKSPSNYQSKIIQKQSRLLIDGSPYIAPYGYTYQYFILNCNNHSIPVVYLKYQSEVVKSTIIYSHGNASNLSESLRFITTIAQLHKADYLAYDYTGYGNSQSKQTTPTSICEDLQIILAYINKPLEQIVLVGFSLGCFPTAKTAAKHKIKGIILMAPMASMISLFEQKISAFTFFKDDEFNLLEIVQNIQSHILIAHSRDDQLIPFHHSQIIYQRYTKISKNPSIELLELRRMKHNQMYLYLCSSHQNTFKRKFFKFLKEVQERQVAQHYIYGRKKLESQKEGKLTQQTKNLLKKESINRQRQHITFSKQHFAKLRNHIKISKQQNPQ